MQGGVGCRQDASPRSPRSRPIHQANLPPRLGDGDVTLPVALFADSLATSLQRRIVIPPLLAPLRPRPCLVMTRLRMQAGVEVIFRSQRGQIMNGSPRRNGTMTNMNTKDPNPQTVSHHLPRRTFLELGCFDRGPIIGAVLWSSGRARAASKNDRPIAGAIGMGGRAGGINRQAQEFCDFCGCVRRRSQTGRRCAWAHRCRGRLTATIGNCWTDATSMRSPLPRPTIGTPRSPSTRCGRVKTFTAKSRSP